MIQTAIFCAVTVLAQPAPESTARAPASWSEFYLDVAKQYQIVRAADRQKLELKEHAIFDWASIDDFHGAVFAWTEMGRPTAVGTIFSLPRGGNQRLAVHEFASFAETEILLTSPDGTRWSPPKLEQLQHLPDATPPPANANLLKLHCRRLAKEFSAHMLRRGERWDLRLLPTPLVEYQQASKQILGGGLFALVGYSTDPEILLLVEARQSADGPAWYFHPVRFSDKSLFLKYKEKPVWESLRAAHGGGGPDAEDPLYRVLASERLAPETVEKLSPPAAKK